MTRFVSKIKQDNSGNISAVVLGNETDYRTKSYGPRCLLTHGNSTVIQKQIRVLSEIELVSEIIVVLGFECDRIIKYLPEDIRVVENQLHRTTNSCESLRLVLNNIKNNRLLIIDGNVLISRDLFNRADFSSSFAVCGTDSKSKNEISFSNANGLVTRFSFGLDYIWNSISFVQGKEFKLLKKSCKDRESEKFFTFEVLNLVIDRGGKFSILESNVGEVKKINSIKDIV